MGAAIILSVLALAAAMQGRELPIKVAIIKASVDAVAECLVRTAPRQSAAFLTAPPLSRQETERGQVLLRGHNHCLHEMWALSTPPAALRGAVAEAVFAREPTLLDRVAPMPGRAADRVPPMEGRPFVVGYAACLVARSPGRAIGLLRTGRGTPRERTAFVSFGETLKACMPTGVNYRVDIAGLRDELAATVYMTATHAAQGA